MQAAIDELDRCDAATILHNLMPMMKAMDAKLNQLLERTAPKSSRVFCTVEDNKDNHFTARCSKFPDSVSRTAQASKLHLCVKCLKPEHDLECGMKCGNAPAEGLMLSSSKGLETEASPFPSSPITTPLSRRCPRPHYLLIGFTLLFICNVKFRSLAVAAPATDHRPVRSKPALKERNSTTVISL
uniref:40S ribosomal protein S12 n=1 Tax=Haemonchus contortus TaxID=6289 RepID=A0A7I4Y0Y8_HAECO